MRIKRYILTLVAFAVPWPPLAVELLAVELLAVESTPSESASGESVTSVTSPAVASQSKSDSASDSDDDSSMPWDYSPYRVLIWLSSDDPTISVDSVSRDLRAYLDRDFSSVWRLDLAPTPTSVRTLASRNMSGLSYDSVTASDPVLAVKRDHPDAVRIRTAANVAEHCQSVLVTANRRDEVLQRAEVRGDPTLHGIADRLNVFAGDEQQVARQWADSATEALLVSRGMAMDLDSPKAKIITPSIDGLVGEVFDAYDKIFVVHVRRNSLPKAVEVVEIDSLMRHFGRVARRTFTTASTITPAMGRAVTDAFAPIVRIENAGQRSATGLLRAGGLIVAESSPARVNVDDVLEPMLRKDDRNGNPNVIGPIDWAVLITTELEDRYLKMDFYAGRAGGLQGRKNKRTFRMALKARPQSESTTLRLHLRQKPDFPLIGYELYEKELDSRKMTFVGRTDWNGRIDIGVSDFPLRLLYVKNGGAVLARLPLVPGLQDAVTADLAGDDMRLQAEAYVRGVQNDITDLIAIRKLYEVRIRKQLEEGGIEQAQAMLNALLRQPDHEELSATIGRKQVEFLEAIGTLNIGQRRKVDDMFTTTRELLSKHITSKLLRDLEAEVRAAQQNGGKSPSAEADSPPAEPVDEPTETSTEESTEEASDTPPPDGEG